MSAPIVGVDTAIGPSAANTETQRPNTLAGAIHSNCTCMKCRAGYAAWNRDRRAAIAAGTWEPFTDAAPVRAHIENLHAKGLPYKQIARLADLDYLQIRRLRGAVGKRPRTEKLRPETAAALLGVGLRFDGLPPKTLVPAQGARRRIQALRALGWPPYVLGELAGHPERVMYELLQIPRIQVVTHQHVAELYEDLRDQNPALRGVIKPITTRGRRYAAAQGWAVPAAWGDIDLDETPDRNVRRFDFQKPDRGYRGRAVVEDAEELAGLGVSQDEIARRIGISWNAIQQACLRAGVEIPAA